MRRMTANQQELRRARSIEAMRQSGFAVETARPLADMQCWHIVWYYADKFGVYSPEHQAARARYPWTQGSRGL